LMVFGSGTCWRVVRSCLRKHDVVGRFAQGTVDLQTEDSAPEGASDRHSPSGAIRAVQYVPSSFLRTRVRPRRRVAPVFSNLASHLRPAVRVPNHRPRCCEVWMAVLMAVPAA
jgi:hypothetical protein